MDGGKGPGVWSSGHGQGTGTSGGVCPALRCRGVRVEPRLGGAFCPYRGKAGSSGRGAGEERVRRGSCRGGTGSGLPTERGGARGVCSGELRIGSSLSAPYQRREGEAAPPASPARCSLARGWHPAGRAGLGSIPAQPGCASSCEPLGRSRLGWRFPGRRSAVERVGGALRDIRVSLILRRGSHRFHCSPPV